jgi:hypothetical protein
LARKKKVSRSQLYTDAIKSYLEDHPTNDVTAKLNEIYGEGESRLDPGLAMVQFAIFAAMGFRDVAPLYDKL